ncbi:alpha/beta fold hydrolase [Nocardia stercoris]|uniref:Alpha/beta fold hydrolase n=1 Tax=Nocardia stercoris TaxID=2483361 RepID=A0A3M2LG84_9NOCA|nr:alpha/beta fold hydrolase [Nocardia stercoris]RMI35603.1 alpha/beta fold hydrolase [Nocardia stercoris]
MAPTLPGHWGGRVLPRWKRGLRAVADGVERDLDDLGLSTCHIVGNSLGGRVGFELARRERAESLATINSSVGSRRFDYDMLRLGTEFLKQYRIALRARLHGEHIVADRRLQAPVLANCVRDVTAVAPEDAETMLRAIARCPTYLSSLAAFGWDEMAIDLDWAQVPTSIMISEFDVYPNHARHVRRVLDDLPDHIREVTPPGVGHIPWLEDAEPGRERAARTSRDCHSGHIARYVRRTTTHTAMQWLAAAATVAAWKNS